MGECSGDPSPVSALDWAASFRLNKFVQPSARRFRAGLGKQAEASPERICFREVKSLLDARAWRARDENVPLFRGVGIVVAATLGIWPVWVFCQMTDASSLSPADAELFRAGLDAQRNQDLKAAEKDYFCW